MRISFNSVFLSSTQNQNGAAMIEYALLVALIAVLSIGSVSLLGENTSDAFDHASYRLAAANFD